MKPTGTLKRRIARALEEQSNPGEEASRASSSTEGHRTLRRRIDRATATEDATPEQDLPLTQKLKRAWASGDMSSVKVQEFAEAAEQQGARGLSKLSSSGTGGVWPQNIQRTLLAFSVVH